MFIIAWSSALYNEQKLYEIFYHYILFCLFEIWHKLVMFMIMTTGYLMLWSPDTDTSDTLDSQLDPDRL